MILVLRFINIITFLLIASSALATGAADGRNGRNDNSSYSTSNSIPPSAPARSADGRTSYSTSTYVPPTPDPKLVGTVLMIDLASKIIGKTIDWLSTPSPISPPKPKSPPEVTTPLKSAPQSVISKPQIQPEPVAEVPNPSRFKNPWKQEQQTQQPPPKEIKTATRCPAGEDSCTYLNATEKIRDRVNEGLYNVWKNPNEVGRVKEVKDMLIDCGKCGGEALEDGFKRITGKE